MRIFFIGTVKFSEGLLEELVKYKDFEIIGIATKKNLLLILIIVTLVQLQKSI
tara:strand:+ start:263 stop:421 length:159 start_codon:yes stop_codon:yes gene_type:complete